MKFPTKRSPNIEVYSCIIRPQHYYEELYDSDIPFGRKDYVGHQLIKIDYLVWFILVSKKLRSLLRLRNKITTAVGPLRFQFHETVVPKFYWEQLDIKIYDNFYALYVKGKDYSGRVAQLGEQYPCTVEIEGSSPFLSTIF